MPDPATALAIDERAGRAHFAVRLIPRASRNAVSGVREGVLHVRVTAAPVNGAANRALVDLLGKYDIRFSTMSGDLDSELEGEINVTGRRDKHIMIGTAETKVTVKTMSGDLEIRASGGTAPASTATAEAEQPDDVEQQTEPMEPRAPTPPPVDVRDLLERVARGEIDVAAAAAALDARREH
jgi:hypothetical protein